MVRMHFRLFPAFSSTVKSLSWMTLKANRNYILFTKLSWPGDSEETFRYSSQTATCFSPKVSHCPFHCWTSIRKSVNYNFFTSFLFHPTGNWNRVYRFSSERFIHSTTDRLMLHFCEPVGQLSNAIAFRSNAVLLMVSRNSVYQL